MLLDKESRTRVPSPPTCEEVVLAAVALKNPSSSPPLSSGTSRRGRSSSSVAAFCGRPTVGTADEHVTCTTTAAALCPGASATGSSRAVSATFSSPQCLPAASLSPLEDDKWVRPFASPPILLSIITAGAPGNCAASTKDLFGLGPTAAAVGLPAAAPTRTALDAKAVFWNSNIGESGASTMPPSGACLGDMNWRKGTDGALLLAATGDIAGVERDGLPLADVGPSVGWTRCTAKLKSVVAPPDFSPAPPALTCVTGRGQSWW